MSERDWKDAKPKWVVDAALAEMKQMKLIAALSWPREAKPVANFGFGDYDNKFGDIETGTFWVSNGNSVNKVSVRPKEENEKGWHHFRFSANDKPFDTNVVRGDYFPTERIAQLHCLWHQCERRANELELYWGRYEDSK